jgi:hypothetical protein
MNKILRCTATLLLLVMTACALPAQISTPTLAPNIVGFITAQAGERATPTPVPTTTTEGMLGWGSLRGRIMDVSTGAPIANAKVTCRQFSPMSPARCNGSLITDGNGAYVFPDLFFLGTDYVQVQVEAPDYQMQTVYINAIESASPVVDVRLVPIVGAGTPQTMICRLRGCATFTPTVTPLVP